MENKHLELLTSNDDIFLIISNKCISQLKKKIIKSLLISTGNETRTLRVSKSEHNNKTVEFKFTNKEIFLEISNKGLNFLKVKNKVLKIKNDEAGKIFIIINRQNYNLAKKNLK